jgi:PAS domain S-box-containing protein
MSKPQRSGKSFGESTFARYAVAVVAVFLAWSARTALTPLWGPTTPPFIFFYPAIVIAAWYGRRGPALLAVALSTLVADWFFIEPLHSFALAHLSEVVALTAFVIVDLILVGAIELMHGARERLATELALRLTAEAQLAAEKKLLATTLTSIGDAVIATDETGTVTFLNGEAERLTGWRTEEACGKPLVEVFQILNEQTRQPVENPVQKVLRLGTVQGLANHTVVISKDGREIPIDDSAAPIRHENGPILGVVLVFRDVTEQRWAHQERARLAAIVEHSGDAIFTKDLNGIIDTWNESARRLFGYSTEEIVGKPVTELIPSELWHDEEEILERLKQGQASEWLETVRLAKDGRRIPVLLTTSPLKNGAGEVVGASKIIRDISDLVKAREEIVREKELLATTLASIGDGVILTDDVGCVTFLNDEAERLTGWFRNEASGRPLTEVFKIINEQTREPAENPVEKVMQHGGAVGLANHTLLVAKDGREIPIDDSAAPIREPGGPLFGVVLVFRDFTQRKLAEDALREREERFRTMADNTPVLIWVSGIDKLCTWFNRQWLEFTGRTMEQELGNGWVEGIHKDDFDRCLRTYVESFDARRAFAMEYRLRRNDGEWRWILDQGTPTFEAGDRFTGYIGSCIDVTDRKLADTERERLLRTEQELRLAAEEANHLKDEFLAIMSHELRNPLNVILGYSELLVRMDEIAQLPQLHHMAEAIKRNAVAQSKLIRDLLDLSRLRSGKLELNKETVSVMVAVRNAIDTIRSDAEAKSITIDVAASNETLFVEADPVRLEQIIWNLLNNSIKFTPPGGRISVRTEKDVDQVCLTIEDTGQGIDASFLPHIFEMFRQADSGTSRAQSGMGVGLAVVQQLVDLHRGSITASSEGAGKGASFTVRMPVSSEAEAKPSAVAGLTTSLDQLTVLVVDDSEDTTAMLEQLLKMSGALVTGATSGHEALRIMAEREFDVVLSDISMPGMDGFEFLRRLRQLPKHEEVPVLALTGFGRPEDIERAQGAGFFSHVTKPFELETLVSLLHKLPKRRGSRN